MSIYFFAIRKMFFFIFKSCYHLKVYGKEHIPRSGAILAPNHVSFYDPPLIAASCKEPTHFLARESLFKKPILRFFLPRLNTHPVSGKAKDSTSFKEVIELLQKGEKVVIFPEGVRSKDGNLSELKPGVFSLALKAECPVVPVYIHGAYEVWNRHHRSPKFFGNISCVFGSPILLDRDLSKEEGQKKGLEELKSKILALKDWVEKGKVGSPP